jgi:hypothetical protein
MNYHAYPPFNTESNDSKFNFKTIFKNEEWQKVPYHAKNIIINLGHLMNNSYFHKSYVTNKNEPRRLADIYQEQNNYFDYVINYLSKYKKLEKDPGTKKAYSKLISLIKQKKKNIVDIKKKNIKTKKEKKEKFMDALPKTKNQRLLFAIVILLVFVMLSK